MIDIWTNRKGKHLRIFTIEQGLLANLANLAFLLLFSSLLNLFLFFLVLLYELQLYLLSSMTINELLLLFLLNLF